MGSLLPHVAVGEKKRPLQLQFSPTIVGVGVFYVPASGGSNYPITVTREEGEEDAALESLLGQTTKNREVKCFQTVIFSFREKTSRMTTNWSVWQMLVW